MESRERGTREPNFSVISSTVERERPRPARSCRNSFPIDLLTPSFIDYPHKALSTINRSVRNLTPCAARDQRKSKAGSHEQESPEEIRRKDVY